MAGIELLREDRSFRMRKKATERGKNFDLIQREDEFFSV